MSANMAFQQILQELRSIHSHLCHLQLKLSNQPQVHSYLNQILLIQHQLYVLERMTLLLFGQGRSLSIYQAYLMLIGLIIQMQQITHVLFGLAQQSLDPLLLTSG
jgi:hypothetical protein